MTTIPVNVTPVFFANRKAYKAGYRRICNQGSTRSSKTYSVVQLLINIAQEEEKVEISICSPSLTHLKKGARKDFLDEMERQGIFREEEFNRTDNVYTFARTGSYVEFFGADEPGRLRGPGRDILFINEANLLSSASYTQLAIRTRRAIFIDFNPADEFSYVYDLCIGPEAKFIHSTYRNNLANLEKAQIEEIERLKDADENLWKVFGLGLRGTSSETIYTHWRIKKRLPLRGELFAGLDFGFNVPSALILGEIWEGAIYLDELLYETKLTTVDLLERMKGMDFSRTLEIFADNAEPKTIEEICRAGYNCLPADKNVLEGIRMIKGMPLYVTERSTNLIKELKSYKWKVNKDGRVLDEPVKFNDHACFTCNTMITLADGSAIPIQDIVPGQKIINSAGIFEVINKFNNGIKTVKDYRMQFDTGYISLSATCDHKIKTDRGWQTISTLQSGQTVYLSKFLMEEFTVSTQAKGIFPVAIEGCMSTFSNSIMVRDPKVTTFTTRMKILGTIGRIISTQKLDVDTFLIMQKRDLSIIRNGLSIFRRKGLLPPRRGMPQKKERNGMNSMPQLRISANSIFLNAIANNAGSYLSHRSTIQNFVPMPVNRPLGEMQDLITKIGPATDVGSLSPQINTPKGDIVQAAALVSIIGSNEREEQVFDLEIDQVHEYLANGLLVSNCDAARYGAFTKLSRPSAGWDAL